MILPSTYYVLHPKFHRDLGGLIHLQQLFQYCQYQHIRWLDQVEWVQHPQNLVLIGKFLHQGKNLKLRPIKIKTLIINTVSIRRHHTINKYTSSCYRCWEIWILYIWSILKQEKDKTFDWCPLQLLADNRQITGQITEWIPGWIAKCKSKDAFSLTSKKVASFLIKKLNPFFTKFE